MSKFLLSEWYFIYLFNILAVTILIFGCLGFSLWKALTHPEGSVYWHIVSGIILLGILLAAMFVTQTHIFKPALYCSIGILSLGVLGAIAGIAAIAIRRTMSMPEIKRKKIAKAPRNQETGTLLKENLRKAS